MSDAFCHACRYNLRGLTLDARCPECGEPVTNSVRLKVSLPMPNDATQSAQRLQLIERLHAAAEIAGCPGDAVMMVFLAMQYVGRRDGPRNLSARAICAALRDYARYAFGGESGAILELASRAIHESEDVGRIVFAMVEAQVFRAGEGDSPGDFQGVFTLDTLFTAQL
ncbi:MAG TPA: hypothetical protein VGR35_17975 [Tepidisphaeraceae bacterium]|nr:hypothetical protein [Tepidisphaeraceae bacterium]